MNDDRLVRDIWKQLPARRVLGERLVRGVGARGWERPRFARFRRFFERCGVPDPWDPAASDVSIALGDVGVAQRKTVAPHAAPPAAAASGPRLPNLGGASSPAPQAPRPAAPVDDLGRPAPRLGDTRRDDTDQLKKKLAESEKKKANPTYANQFRVQQPVAKLPMRPDLAEGGAPPPRPSAPRPAGGTSTPPRPGGAAPRAIAPTAPRSGGGAAGPRAPRIPIELSRPPLPDGPEELPEQPPVAARPGGDRPYEGFGLGGGWEEEPAAPPPVRAAAPGPAGGRS